MVVGGTSTNEIHCTRVHCCKLDVSTGAVHTSAHVLRHEEVNSRNAGPVCGEGLQSVDRGYRGAARLHFPLEQRLTNMSEVDIQASEILIKDTELPSTCAAAHK